MSPSPSKSCLALVLLFSAPFALRAAAPPASPDAAQRELSELGGRLDEERERFMLGTAALGGIAKALDDEDSKGRQAAEVKSMIVALLEERRKATVPLELKTAILAEQLDRYKKTGVFSPTPPATVASLKKLIDAPWAVWAGRKPVAALSLDLALLQKELRRWQEKPESFPAPPKRPAPPAAALVPAPGFGFVRDRGTGRTQGEPVPELILQLSSPDARRRALAADALAGRGAAARPALTALTLALSDLDGRVRASAALALGAVGALPPDAAAGLRLALDDKNAEVRLSARLALRRLEGPPPAARPE